MNIQPPYGFMPQNPNSFMLPNDINQPYNLKIDELENRISNLEKRLDNLENQKGLYQSGTYNTYPTPNMHMM